METRAAAAVWEPDGRLTAWIPNQGAQGTRSSLAGMLGIDEAILRIITPDVGGAFGAKFGADPEHGVVCWVARQLGRPARWTETRNENLVGMTHGRAQIQKVTIGGSRDGTVGAYRIEILQDFRGLPEVRRVPALPDHPDGARALRLPARRGGGDVGGDQHHAGRRLPRRGTPGGHRGGGAGHGPVRRRDRRGPGRGAPQEPAARLHRAAHHRVRRRVRQRRLRHRPGQGAGRGGLQGPAGRAGQAARRRRGGPARHRPVLLRGDHRGRRRGGRGQGERHRRGPPGRQRHHLDRDPRRTARAIRPCGPCWPARSSASRWTGSP